MPTRTRGGSEHTIPYLASISKLAPNPNPKTNPDPDLDPNPSWSVCGKEAGELVIGLPRVHGGSLAVQYYPYLDIE